MDIDGEADPVPPALRDDSNDPGWKYGKYCDPNNKTKVKCDFCGHISTGGIYRFKQHVAATDNCVKPCKKATPEAIAECKNHLNHVVESKSTKRQRYQDLTDDVHVSSGTTYDTSRDDVCVGSSSSDPNKLGPMDKFVHPIDGKSSKEEALRQLSMNEALFKERVHQVSQYLARWVYTHAIPFDALDNDEFKQMCEAIGKFGPGYEPPSQSELREKLLSEEWFKKADDSVIDNDSKEEKEHAQMEIRTATGSSFVEELDHMSLQERYKILLANKRSSASKEISSALSIIGSMDADNNVSLLGEIPLDTQISSVECIVNGKKIPCDPACLVDVKMEPALDGYAIYPSESPCVSEKVLEEDADKNDEGIAYPSRRRRKKKTATDSIETALEEDAPGLLQILLDRGIVVKEIKLYDVGEDNEMIADCTESDFQDLENVLAKLFPQRASLLKSAARHAGGGKAIYCLACLISLIEQSRYLQFRHCPVEWGWCRDLQSFIFVFRSHNRLVLERPEYGYATYFFEIVQSVPVEWQIRRLVTAMKLSSCGRTALIENRPLLVGEDLTEGEAKVLEEYGWIPSTGLGTMLNYRDRVVHDRWNEKYSTDWRMKIGRLLMNGYSEGNLIIPHGPTKMLSEEEIKLEEI